MGHKPPASVIPCVTSMALFRAVSHQPHQRTLTVTAQFQLHPFLPQNPPIHPLCFHIHGNLSTESSPRHHDKLGSFFFRRLLLAYFPFCTLAQKSYLLFIGLYLIYWVYIALESKPGLGLCLFLVIIFSRQIYWIVFPFCIPNPFLLWYILVCLPNTPFYSIVTKWCWVLNLWVRRLLGSLLKTFVGFFFFFLVWFCPLF